MDSQIIISKEDNTDFLSIGYIQTDTSLVSALGGALSSFAEEIGLSGNNSSSTKAAENTINFSRFPNGILASKMVTVQGQTPIILLAMRGYEGDDKDLNFMVDFAEVLANQIITKFMSEYQSIGIIPKIEDAYEIIMNVANQMNKRSSEKVKFFTKNYKNKITDLLDKVWSNQDEFERWANAFSTEKITTMTQSNLQQLLAKYFYIYGIKDDALFPLFFSTYTNPLSEITGLMSHFLSKKTTIARNEIISEVDKIISQLKDASKNLSQRGAIEISDVEMINESYIFEKMLVAKTDNLASVANDLLSSTIKDLYKKLFRKYPLNFVAMSKLDIFDKSELEVLVKNSINTQLKSELADRQWILEKILAIIRQVTAKYSPKDINNKQEEILDKIYEEFKNATKKEHPFVALADPSFAEIEPIVKKMAKEALEKFRTSLDEAVILYNVIGQTHSTLANENSPSIQDLMILYFLQTVIEPYQLREVPDMVYTLIAECLANTGYGKKNKPSEIVENSISQFEQKLQFQILAETKNLVVQRISKAKPTLQNFENFENVSFFFHSFRTSLETTLAKTLQTIFGPEKLPNPPNELIRMINDFIFEIQDLYTLILFLNNIVKRPGGREIFSSEGIKFLDKNSKFKSILPTSFELAEAGYNSGWLKPLDQKKISGMNEAQLRLLQVKIPSLKLEGQVHNLLTNPTVYLNLWLKFAPNIIDKKQEEIKKLVSNLEKQAKTSAGDTSGKQKYGVILKKMKELNKALASVVAGGGIMRKIFATTKDLNQISQEVVKETYPLFKCHPDDFNKILQSGLHLNTVKLESVVGDFQDLLTIYSSLWLADSKYIDSIEDQFFWEGIHRANTTNGNPLERKIIANLKSGYKKGIDSQKVIIRRTITEEVVPLFNELIRNTLTTPFKIFQNDRIIEFDDKTKDWYISLGKVGLPKKYLQTIFSSMGKLYFETDSDERSDIRYSLSNFLSQKRSKDSQSIEEFLRRALYQTLSKNELKAIEFFSELNEKYIGKDASNTFYSYFRSLAQTIISPSE